MEGENSWYWVSQLAPVLEGENSWYWVSQLAPVLEGENSWYWVSQLAPVLEGENSCLSWLQSWRGRAGVSIFTTFFLRESGIPARDSFGRRAAELLQVFQAADGGAQGANLAEMT